MAPVPLVISDMMRHKFGIENGILSQYGRVTVLIRSPVFFASNSKASYLHVLNLLTGVSVSELEEMHFKNSTLVYLYVKSGVPLIAPLIYLTALLFPRGFQQKTKTKGVPKWRQI